MDIRSKYQSFLIQYHAGVARDLPIISPFGQELVRLPRTKVPSLEQLTRAFQTDPFLAAKLTGAANSVFFAHDHFTVLTVSEALGRVGIRYAMNLVWEAPPLPLGLESKEVTVLWAHCMAVAHTAQAIAASMESAPFEPEVVHLVAMIHDIGYLLQLSYSPSTWGDIAARLDRDESDTDNAPHQLQGEELARFWSLPLAAVAAIKSHHEPNSISDERACWLSSVVAISEALSRRNSDLPPDGARTWSAEPMRRELNLARELLPRLRAEALQVWGECMQSAHRPGATWLMPRLQLVHAGVKDVE